MRLIDICQMAYHNLVLNKRRSLMAMLGIVIAVAGVQVIATVGFSAKQFIFNEIKTFGLQTVWIYRDLGRLDLRAQESNGSGIYASDIPVILHNSKHIQLISPVIEQQKRIMGDANSVTGRAIYTTPAIFEIENEHLVEGRLLTDLDLERNRKVCVITRHLALQIFKNESAIGELITVEDELFEIIGILRDKDRSLLHSIGIGGDQTNGNIYLPISSALNQRDSQQIDYIELAATNTKDSNLAANEAIQSLNRIHHGQFEYDSAQMKTYINSFEKIVAAVAIILTVAMVVSLAIGGIGIANMMTTAVLERTREIGIRKAIGATYSDIYRVFLAEALFLTTGAGAAGVLIGVFLCLIGRMVAPSIVVFPYVFAFFGLVIAAVTGVISGIYPAAKAARLRPVEALRYE